MRDHTFFFVPHGEERMLHYLHPLVVGGTSFYCCLVLEREFWLCNVYFYARFVIVPAWFVSVGFYAFEYVVVRGEFLQYACKCFCRNVVS